MNAPPIGKMRTAIAIQERIETRDTFGGPTLTWSTVATRWGRVEPLSGRELWQAQAARPDVSHRITLRHYDGLTPRHRLLVGSRVFNIESVLNIEEKGRVSQVMAKEEVT